jgi:DNA primase
MFFRSIHTCEGLKVAADVNVTTEQQTQVVQVSSVLKNRLKEAGVAAWLAFSGSATFHLSSKVKHHNVYVLVFKNSYQVLELEQNSSQLKVHCATSHNKIYSLFLFA